ncbi:MAG: transcription elongation factor GreA [Lachnospiraceae bacterium]|nr:transcription elongation factor GreA [Lachnospiraceae bacterium]
MNDRLTKNDIRKMEEEIEHRKLVIRKEALEAVKEARAQGDLSENFEYYAAKKYKNQNESRIRYLERMIKTAEIIEDDAKEDEIGLNKTVTVLFEEDGMVETYRLVTTVRNNPLKGLISIESPIAKALIGHKAGERVYVQVNDGFGYYVTIQTVENTPDDDSIEIRKF